MPSSPEIIDVLLSIASGAEKREDRLVPMLNDIPHEQRGKLILDVLTKIVFDRLPAAVDEFVSAWELSGVPQSVLYYAVSRNDTKNLKLFLSLPNTRDYDDSEILGLAAKNGYLECMQLLIDSGKSEVSADEYAPLARAIIGKNEDAVKKLLPLSDLSTKDFQRWMIAVEDRSSGILSLLFEEAKTRPWHAGQFPSQEKIISLMEVAAFNQDEKTWRILEGNLSKDYLQQAIAKGEFKGDTGFAVSMCEKGALCSKHLSSPPAPRVRNAV